MIKELTDEEADALWELKVPLRYKFKHWDKWSDNYTSYSPRYDRENYTEDTLFVFGVEVDEDD